MPKRSVVLVVLDGWGIAGSDFTNPIHVANPQNINYIKQNFPTGSLQASGIAVGLPWGEEGNSEVGHLNMGAGKIIYQNYPRISLAIRSGEFFKNETVKKAFDHAKKNNSSVNFVGLLTDANVHASLEHLTGLIQFAEKENFPKERVNLHLITDGRDSPPKSAFDLIARLPDINQLASIGGRFYSMDRDKHWDRIQKGYDAMVGQGQIITNYKAHIEESYQKNLNDEYILPALIGPKIKPIKDNDAVVFFNFREDRMKQIVRAFTEKDFDAFPTKQFSNLYVCTMIKYDKFFNTDVISNPDAINTCLSQILADRGKIQWKIAETEKYAHITYFFNGQKETPFQNEYRILMPSLTGFKYDEHPEMRAEEITQRLVEAIEENTFDFILANYANADIIAHTGNFKATVEAIKILDEKIGKLVKAAIASNAILIITSDHGNAERLVNPETGEPETKHDTSPVPFYLIANEYKREKTPAEIRNSEIKQIGVLSDVAPTILDIMKIKIPQEMTGQSLLDLLV